MVQYNHSRWLLALALQVVATGTISQAATITVRADGTGDYPTIQAAIDAAQAGDEVVLQPGAYMGDGNSCVRFNGKAITLRSTVPEDPTIVAATVVWASENWMHFYDNEGPGSILAGLTITGGQGQSMSMSSAAIICVGSPTIRNCVIRDCTNDGISLVGDALVRNCIFEAVASGISIHGGSPRIEDCLMRNCSNCAVYCDAATDPVMSRCTMLNNTGLWGGAGGMLGGHLTIRDSLIMNNVVVQTPLGPACTFGLYGGSLTIENCTIVGNSGGFARIPDAQATDWGNGPLVVRNSILWGNPGGPVLPDPTVSIAPVEVSYSVIETGCLGTGVLDLDPKILPNGRLAPGSPCINAGDPAFVPALGETDVDGQPRVLAGRVDIGADEHAAPGDANADGVVNVGDLQLVVAAWGSSQFDWRYQSSADFNGDGQINVGDLQVLVAYWGQ